MARVYLVRHGRAQGDWGAEPDPGLDPAGLKQAIETAHSLAPLGPLRIVSSPHARALETSKPLAEIWRVTPRVDDRLGEIPSPEEEPAGRRQWLRQVMAKRWLDMNGNLRAWRRNVIEAIHELKEGSVLFSHFIAINVIVGEATDDDRVVCFWPQNASVTTIDVTHSALKLCEIGIEDTHHAWKNIKL